MPIVKGIVLNMNTMMTPAQVASNRTARLVREVSTPVYTTSTKPVVREHMTAVETDSPYGRHWSHMLDSQVEEFLANVIVGDTELSDIDHSGKCWCQK